MIFQSQGLRESSFSISINMKANQLTSIKMNNTQVLAPANDGKIGEPLGVWLRRLNDKVMSTPSDLEEMLAVKSSGATGILWK